MLADQTNFNSLIQSEQIICFTASQVHNPFTVLRGFMLARTCSDNYVVVTIIH